MFANGGQVGGWKSAKLYRKFLTIQKIYFIYTDTQPYHGLNPKFLWHFHELIVILRFLIHLRVIIMSDESFDLILSFFRCLPSCLSTINNLYSLLLVDSNVVYATHSISTCISVEFLIFPILRHWFIYLVIGKHNIVLIIETLQSFNI